jgi:succinyl-CoA synthetase beta subunit
LKIHEYQAKEILRKYGATTPPGEVCTEPLQAFYFASKVGPPVVVKAQVHVGGRGKAGGIRLAKTPEEAQSAAEQIIGMTIKSHQAPEGLLVEKVLVEKALDIAEEYYIGIVIDRSSQRNVLMVSSAGGMDIEEVADKTPEKIAKIFIDPARGLDDFEIRRACFEAKLAPKAIRGVTGFVNALYNAFVGEDASLAEINPLAVTKDGEVTAADAKIVIDDNALYRHPDLEALAEASGDLDDIEKVAHEKKIAYVHLKGNIGVLGNGAGLVMATMDEVKRAGGEPSNFLDIGGGAKSEQMRQSLEIVTLDKNVNGIVINVFGGIVRCDWAAQGIVDALAELKLKMPIVVRLTGTNEEEGWRILGEAEGITPAPTMQAAAAKIVQLTN